MKKSVIGFCVAFILLCSACSNLKQETEQIEQNNGNEENAWVLESFTLSDPNEKIGSTNVEVLYNGVMEETIFRFARAYNEEGKVIQYFVQTMSMPYTTWETKNILPDDTISIFNYMNLWVSFTEEAVLNCVIQGEENYYLEQISADGKYSVKKIVSDELVQALQNVHLWHKQGDNSYFCSENDLICYQSDSGTAQNVNRPKAMFINQILEDASKDKLYLWGTGDSGEDACLWQIGNESPVLETNSISSGKSVVVFISSNEGYGVARFCVKF